MKAKEETLEALLTGGFDCAWVLGKSDGDFRNPMTALLDWKMRGQLTRIRDNSKKLTVIPAMGSLPIPFVVLDPSSEPDWSKIREKCEGVQWKNVLLVLEEEVKTSVPKTYFEKVVVRSP